MKLNAYSNSDLNMYLSNTYTIFDNKPIKINNLELVGSRGSSVRFSYNYSTPSGRSRSDVTSVSGEDEFDLVPVPMGYYTIGNFVVYLYKHQRSHFKKLTCNETLRYFTPQERELRLLSVPYRVDYEKLILGGQEFLSLDEAYEKMQRKDVYSVALHPNYALVKKGSKRDLVIYYKTDPVITYDGETLTAIVDECHVNKFKLELEL